MGQVIVKNYAEEIYKRLTCPINPYDLTKAYYDLHWHGAAAKPESDTGFVLARMVDHFVYNLNYRNSVSFGPIDRVEIPGIVSEVYVFEGLHLKLRGQFDSNINAIRFQAEIRVNPY